MTKKRLVFYSITFILLFLLVWGANTVWQNSRLIENLPVEKIEEYVGQSFPASARDVNSVYDGRGMDKDLYYKFTANSIDVENYLKEIGIEYPLDNEYGRYFGKPPKSYVWWNQSEVSKGAGKQIIRNDGTWYDVLVYPHKLGETEEDVYIVTGEL